VVSTDISRDMDEHDANREIAAAGRPLIEENRRLRAVLSAVDNTLTAHGHMDANTPLHERITEVLKNA